MTTVLATLAILGVGAWIGGFATVFLVSRSSKAALTAPQRVGLFREFGRRYAVIASTAMTFILVPAAILTFIDSSHTAALLLLVVSIVIVIVSIPAIRQARRMGALRRAALDDPTDAGKAQAIARSARSAAVLRSLLGAGSLLMLVLALML